MCSADYSDAGTTLLEIYQGNAFVSLPSGADLRVCPWVAHDFWYGDWRQSQLADFGAFLCATFRVWKDPHIVFLEHYCYKSEP